MASTKQVDVWEAEELARVAAEAEERRVAEAAAEVRRKWEAEDRARYAELIGPETDRVVEKWEADRLRQLRQRAELNASSRVRGLILHDRAVTLTGPFSVEVMAAEGRQLVAAAWPGCPGLTVPALPDEDWRPAHVRQPWLLKDDGVYRRFHGTTMSVPPAGSGPLLGYVPNTTVTGDPLEYWVCSPVWPLDVAGGTARFAVRKGKGWSVEEIRLGPDVDPLEALLGRGVNLNKDPLMWTRVGAATGEKESRRMLARQLFAEFIDDARRFERGTR